MPFRRPCLPHCLEVVSPVMEATDMGGETDFCHRDGQPRLTSLSAVQGMQCRLEERRTRPMARQIKPDSARVLRDHRRQFSNWSRSVPICAAANGVS
jgi:hypothetical protein